MAFPALIQKIFNLRGDVSSGECDRVRLAAETLRMSNRITGLELKNIITELELAQINDSVESGVKDRSRLAAEWIRTSNRVTTLELAYVDSVLGGRPVVINIQQFGPEGYKLANGATVAPVTMVSESTGHVDGAALTMVLDNK